jgi:hypothetical protein
MVLPLNYLSYFECLLCIFFSTQLYMNSDGAFSIEDNIFLKVAMQCDLELGKCVVEKLMGIAVAVPRGCLQAVPSWESPTLRGGRRGRLAW